MSKYLFKVNYIGDLAKGLLKEGGTARRAEIEKVSASLGGRIESFYYSLGETNAYVTLDLPDQAAAMTLTIMAKAIGLECAATLLLSPEEMDEAVKKTAAYRAPGQ